MTARYMIVSYFQKPSGKWDEVTEFKNSLRMKHMQTAKVILDFKEQKCVKNGLNKDATFEDMILFFKKTMGDQLTPHLPIEYQRSL
jgi:hypothetical protein